MSNTKTLTGPQLYWLFCNYANTKNADICTYLKCSQSFLHKLSRFYKLSKSAQFMEDVQKESAIIGKTASRTYYRHKKEFEKSKHQTDNTKFVFDMKQNIFVQLCKGYCGADVVTEYQFHPKRKWRFDYAIPSHKIAIEVEGGAWIDGRHNRASGFLKDMEKYNAAAVLGWRLLRVTPQQLLTTATLQMVSAAIKNFDTPK